MERSKWDRVVAQVCDSFDLLPKHIPRAKDAKQVVRLNGSTFFHCSRCQKSWTTHFAWMAVDLRARRVAYVWKQKCMSCNQVRIVRRVSRKSLEAAMRKAVLH